MGSGDKKIVIRRALSSAPVSISIECAAGAITVLSDREGRTGTEYEKALLGRPTEDKFLLQWEGQSFSAEDLHTAGFGDPLPQEYGAKEFLSRSGLSAADAEALIDRYELKKHFYLSCSQLPAAEGRKLVLLRALQLKGAPLVLNDPFAPFNGRWREHFAEILAEYAAREQVPVIILNLGFYPQLWMKDAAIKKIDVGEIAQKELEKLIQLEVEEKKIQKKREEQKAPPPPPAAKTVAAAAAPQEKLSPEDLQNLTYGYRGVNDWIFEPLARASTFARSFSGALAIGGMAFLVAVMGIVMFPEFREGHGKIAALVKRLGGITWSTPADGPQEEIALNRSKPVEPSDALIEASSLSAPSVEEIENGDLEEIIASDVSPQVEENPLLELPHNFTRELTALPWLWDGNVEYGIPPICQGNDTDTQNPVSC